MAYLCHASGRGMHLAVAVLLVLAALAVAHRACVQCARNQRAGFLDRPDPRRKIIYQPLPTTQV